MIQSFRRNKQKINTSNVFHLSEDDLFSLSSLSLIELLTNARQHVQARSQRVLHLFTDEL